VQPAVVVFAGHDDGHAVVEGLHDRVGVSGDDGEGLEGSAGGVVLLCLPESGKGHGFGVFAGDGPYLLFFDFGVEFLPFVEEVGGDEAVAALEGLAEEGRGGDVFGAGIDRGVADFGVLGPVGDEAHFIITSSRWPSRSRRTTG
jgi:hypothetical protein